MRINDLSRRRRTFTAILLLCGLSAPSFLGAQSGEDIGTLPALLAEAEKDYQNFHCDKAELKLERARALIRATEAGRPLRVDEETLALRAGELLALCRLDDGKTADAQNFLRENIKRRSTYQLSAGASSKIKKLLEEVRGKTVGIVVVNSSPAGAEVFLAGVSIGKTPIDTGLLAGQTRLEFKKPGFAPATLDVNVVLGSRQTVSVTLVPTGRNYIAYTRQAGIEILVDGEPAGKTAPLVNPGAEVASFLAGKGFSPLDTSSLDIGFLVPGPHLLTYRKPCLKTGLFTVDTVLSSDPYHMFPQELQASRGSLKLDSRPSGASLFINGEARGVTPFVSNDFCGGEHEVKIELPGRGRWAGRIEVGDGGTVEKVVNIRPNLVYLGVYTGDDSVSPEAVALDSKTRQRLAGLKRYNASYPPAEEWRAQFPQAGGALGRAPDGAALADPALSGFAGAYGAQLIAILSAPPGGGAGLKLYSPRSQTVDFIAAENGDVSAFSRILDADDFSAGTWIGAGLAPAEGMDGLLVGATRLDPAVLQPGDRLLRIGSQRLDSSVDLTGALAGKTTSDLLQATRLRGGIEAPITLKVLPLLRHLPPSGPVGPLSKLEIDMEGMAGDLDPDISAIGRLNQALLAWRAGRVTEALDALGNLRIPARRGINQGTIEYLKGLLLVGRGEKEAARRAFLIAMADGGATFLSDNGPAIAPLARAALGPLGGVPAPTPPAAAPARK